MYPKIRLRRNRKSFWLRELVAENILISQNLILPIFVIEGINQRIEITSMPGVYHQSIDEVIITAKKAATLGIMAIALFPVIKIELKNDEATEAFNSNNLICRAVKAIKNAKLNIGVICDVALDPYTDHGHDGIVIEGKINNDITVGALCTQALTLANAGVDIIAPSDMMDGRIGAIREALDQQGFEDINILSYAAKYASNFYQPFRDAVNNTKEIPIDKSTYQLDVRNINEALKEIEADITEGADIIMVKPGLSCLDLIYAANINFNAVIFAYQVSGEYAMLKFASLAGALNWEKSLIESLVSLKRAGAKAILTYAALEAAEILNNFKTN